MDVYKIEEHYTFMGNWWVAGSEKKFAGILKYDPDEKETILDLWGHSEFQNLNYNNDYIFGITSKGKYIKLTNPSHNFSTYSGGINSSHVHHQVFIDGYILVSPNHELIEKEEYKKIIFTISNQHNFIRKTGFSRKFNFNKGDLIKDDFQLNFKAPENINLYSDNEIDLDISFSFEGNAFVISNAEIRSKQKEVFNITSVDFNSVDYYKNPIQRLRNFITFSLRYNTKVEMMYFLNDPSKAAFEKVYFLKHDQVHFMEEIKFRDCDSRFFLNDLESYNNLYKQWIKLYNDKTTALDGYFFHLYNNSKFFIEERFLSLVNVFEDYYSNSPEYKQSNAINEHQQNLIDTILKPYSGNDRKWIKSQLSGVNSISLLEKIKFITDKNQSIFLTIIDPKFNINLILTKLIDSRNYLVHHNPKLKEKSFDNPGYYIYCSQLILIILQLLIMDDLNIDEGLKCSSVFKEYFIKSLQELNWDDFITG